MLDENQLFAEWRAAKGELREKLLEQLSAVLKKHAEAVAWEKLNTSVPSNIREEIVYDAVWRGIMCSESFKGEAKFSTWFHSIISNLCSSELRRRLYDRTVPLEHIEEDNNAIMAPPMSDAPIELAQLTEDLSKEDLNFIEMKKLNFTETEIAKELGINLVTVRQRWMRIKERIRRNVQ